MTRIRTLLKYLATTYLFISACDERSTAMAGGRAIIVVKDMSLSTPAAEDSLDRKWIASLFGYLRSADKVQVIGITEASFTNPQVFLHGEMPIDRHPLQAKILRAREDLAKRWQAKSLALKLRSRKSDILGAICYASLLFPDDPSEKWLVILSDMRHSSPALNIENVKTIPIEATLVRISEAGFLPNLSGVKVAVLGAHTVGRNVSPGFYQSLEAFWRSFFVSAEAELVTFRPARDWMFDINGR